jgi:hypothetical protein
MVATVMESGDHVRLRPPCAYLWWRTVVLLEWKGGSGDCRTCLSHVI